MYSGSPRLLKVLTVFKSIFKNGGPAAYAGMCSDSTASVAKGRHLAHEKEPSIIDTGDSIHGMHNTIKEMTKIDHFKPVRILTIYRASS